MQRRTRRARPAAAIFLACLTTLAGGPWTQAAQSCDWRHANQEGLKIANQGDLKSARTILEAAAAQALKEHEQTLDCALVYNNLGFVNLELDNYRQAEPMLLRAVAILSDAPTKDTEHEANACDNLGRLYWRSGRWDKAEPLLLKALAMQEAAQKYDSDFLATRYENLGEFYSQQGEYAQSEQAFRKAVSLREKPDGNEKQLRHTIVRLATVCQSERKQAEAESLLKRALALTIKETGASSAQTSYLKDRLIKNQNPIYPDIKVISPTKGETFKSTPIVVTVAVSNFKLDNPQPKFDHPRSCTLGHIHYMVDNHPPIATAATRIMIEGGPAFLDEGEHTLWIELVNEVHQPLTPPVRRKIKFNLVH